MRRGCRWQILGFAAFHRRQAIFLYSPKKSMSDESNS
jgi:hypothetical protein